VGVRRKADLGPQLFHGAFAGATVKHAKRPTTACELT